MRKRSFEEFVMTYTVKEADGSERILVTIEDYHKKYIQPLDPRFKWDFYNGYKGKVLCWCKNHEDKKASGKTVNAVILTAIGSCKGVPLTSEQLGAML